MNVRSMMVTFVLLMVLAACGSKTGIKSPETLPQATQDCEKTLAGGSFEFKKYDGGHWEVKDQSGLICITGLLFEVEQSDGLTQPLEEDGVYLIIKELKLEDTNLLYGYLIRPAGLKAGTQ